MHRAWLLATSGSLTGFAGSRTVRLIPPAVAMAVIVPPQPWVELVSQHGYSGEFCNSGHPTIFASVESEGADLAGRRVGWLRPLIGLARRKRERPAAEPAAPATGER